MGQPAVSKELFLREIRVWQPGCSIVSGSPDPAARDQGHVLRALGFSSGGRRRTGRSQEPSKCRPSSVRASPLELGHRGGETGWRVLSSGPPPSAWSLPRRSPSFDTAARRGELCAVAEPSG